MVLQRGASRKCCSKIALNKNPSPIMNVMSRIVPALIGSLVSACASDPGSSDDRACTTRLLGLTPSFVCRNTNAESQSLTATRSDLAKLDSITLGGCLRIQLDPDERGGLRIPPQVVCPIAGLRLRDGH